MKAIQFELTLPRYALGITVGKVMPRILWSGLSCTRYIEVPGASEVITASHGMDVFAKVAERTGARVKKPMVGRRIMVGGVDRTLECIGSTISIDNALRMTRAGGRVVLVGMPGTARLDWSSIFVKELVVCASLAYNRAEEYEGARQSTFKIASSLIQQGKVNLDWMVPTPLNVNPSPVCLAGPDHRSRKVPSGLDRLSNNAISPSCTVKKREMDDRNLKSQRSSGGPTEMVPIARNGWV